MKNIKLEVPKTETDHQREVVEYLKSVGYEIFRMNSGRKGGIRLNKIGTPDLLIQKDGISIWVEMKKPGKKPTKIQLERHFELKANGFTVLVIHSLEELLSYSKK